MDDDSYEVPVRGSDGQGRTATFILHDHETDDAVTLRLIDGARTFSATADDYFEALVQLRQATAHHDLILSCYGASRNVFPSGMSRQMSRGTMAYKLTLGQPARIADVINIFASGPDMEIVTVEEQWQFFHHWLDSLRSRTENKA